MGKQVGMPGTAVAIQAHRQKVLDGAYAANPDRFHGRRPRPALPAGSVDQPAPSEDRNRGGRLKTNRACCLIELDTLRLGGQPPHHPLHQHPLGQYRTDAVRESLQRHPD